MFGRPVAVALLAFATLEVAAAVALLRRRRWARYGLYGVTAAQLVIFPIGTALALYTSWALMATDLSDTTRLNSSALGACWCTLWCCQCGGFGRGGAAAQPAGLADSLRQAALPLSVVDAAGKTIRHFNTDIGICLALP